MHFIRTQCCYYPQLADVKVKYTEKKCTESLEAIADRHTHSTTEEVKIYDEETYTKDEKP